MSSSVIATQMKDGQPPTYEVVIPFGGGLKLLGLALTSIQRQTVKPAAVHIGDDNSPEPPTPEWLAQFDLLVHVYRTPDRSGPAAARNIALSACSAPFIAFLDADDEWLPTKASRQLDVLLRSPDCVLVSCERQWVGLGGEPLVMKESHALPAGDALLQLVRGNALQPSMVMIRRSALGDMRFDSSIWFAEDWDLWIRLSRVGPFAVVPERLVLYRWHGSNSSRQARVMNLANEQVLEKVLRTADGRAVRKIAKQHLRSVRETLGHLAFQDGDWEAARRYLLKSNSLSRSAIVRLAATLLPTRLVRALVSCRR